MFQNNSHIKALEDSIAEANYEISEAKHGKYKHPERKIKELKIRINSLEELIQMVKLIRKINGQI